jgi:hypothetical protein
VKQEASIGHPGFPAPKSALEAAQTRCRHQTLKAGFPEYDPTQGFYPPPHAIDRGEKPLHGGL